MTKSLPAALIETAIRQEGLLSTRQLVSSGIDKDRIARLCRVGTLVRQLRGVYAADGLVPPVTTVGQQLDRARRRSAFTGALAHGPDAVATGLCALVLHGVHGVPAKVRPEVALPKGADRVNASGVRIRRTALAAMQQCHGVWVATAEVALAQAVLEVNRLTAISLMDSARSQRILTEAGFRRAQDLVRGRRGAAKARPWWGESDQRSQSPAETEARLYLSAAGFAPDAVQLPVRTTGGRVIARVDLAWWLPDGRWLLGEIDGIEWHSGRRDVVADLARQNRLVTDATILRRWTGGDVRRGAVTSDVASLLRAAGWRAGQRSPESLDI
jgi:hypothetical protein